MKEDGHLRQERYDKTLEAIRGKHKVICDSKEDEIGDLHAKASDFSDKYEKTKVEKDSLSEQLDKLKDSVRDLKADSASQFDRVQKQQHSSEFHNLEKI